MTASPTHKSLTFLIYSKIGGGNNRLTYLDLLGSGHYACIGIFTETVSHGSVLDKFGGVDSLNSKVGSIASTRHCESGGTALVYKRCDVGILVIVIADAGVGIERADSLVAILDNDITAPGTCAHRDFHRTFDRYG